MLVHMRRINGVDSNRKQGSSLMIRWLKRSCVLLAISVLTLILVSILLWGTLTTWLPLILKHWLPAGTSIQFEQRPYWQKGKIYLPKLRYLAGTCQLANLTQARLRYQNMRWQLVADTLSFDSACLQKLPQNDHLTQDHRPLALDKIQQSLPLFDVAIKQLQIMPWRQYRGAISLTNNKQGQMLRYRGEMLNIDATLNEQQELKISHFAVKVPQMDAPLSFNGQLKIPIDLASLPRNGQMNVQLTTPMIEQPLQLTNHWQGNHGELSIQVIGDKTPLISLPWTVSRHSISIEQGEWHWPYAEQPLQGRIAFTLNQWDKGYQHAQLQARINVVTQGAHGKGNVVLNLGPGLIGLTESRLPFRLTGKINREKISLYAGIPGEIKGKIINPDIDLLSGALLRTWGQLGLESRLDEARLPLAGIRLNAEGISGRLQAIVQAHDKYWGKVKLHLDGKAEKFIPDRKGKWQWKYWGDGTLPPLNAQWDMQGLGDWQMRTLQIKSLSTGFDKIHYGATTVLKPRLTLSKPFVWQRKEKAPTMQAQLKLDTQKIAFSYGGRIVHALLTLNGQGTSFDNLLFNGDLQAKDIGPIRVNARWDGDRLRGNTWWSKQTVTVFQPLLTEESKIKLREGIFHAQTAFSAARNQGFEAGGHLVVKDAAMWLKEGELSGLDFILPYRYSNQRWQFGIKQPVSLRIKRLTNLFVLENISADLQGYYPYDDYHPLTFSNVGFDVLRGNVRFDEMTLPQPAVTVLKMKAIDLSELFTVLNPKQIAMSGKVDGELPLYLKDPHWLVHNGWVNNAGMLTLRLDKNMVDAMSADNIVTGTIIDLLRYLEISRTRADINLSNLGILTMKAQIKGINSAQKNQPQIVLNYRHEENIFQLWRSLRFAANLQEWLEKQLSLPTRKKNGQP